MLNLTRARGRPGSAFTLLELVVVILILATLAGLVVPQVSMLGRSSDMAATAKNASDVANNLGLFFVLQKRYPQGMDSLLTSTGTLYGPQDLAGGTPTEATQVRGLPISGPSLYADLTVGTFDNTAPNQFLRSFTRCGFDWVYDHDNTAINSNMSGLVRRELIANPSAVPPVTAPTSIQLAEVVAGSVIADKLFPPLGALPPNTRLVALGVGPNVTATGKTMLNAPIFPGCDGKYYGRYIAFFLVYASGERATLVGVSDSYGRTNDYSIQQFNESLPDGTRQS